MLQAAENDGNRPKMTPMRTFPAKLRVRNFSAETHATSTATLRENDKIRPLLGADVLTTLSDDVL